MNRFRWNEREAPVHGAVAALADRFAIPEAGARFLLSRDLSEPEAVERYLNPGPDDSHDPFLFSRMHEAVALVDRAVRERRHVMIHGDYDVDGISGTALLFQYLDGVVGKVSRFVPDRRRDGYGVSARAVDWALENGVGLAIVVDCGTSDGVLLGRLEDAGVDVIVCDHHELPAEGGTRGVLLNPVRDGETYPFRGLSGTGVAFKLVQALEASGVHGGIRADTLLDLTALATVGDMCPLVGENRYFVRSGLELMNRSPRPGVDAIKGVSRIGRRDITASHISFALAPRLNAPGRVARPRPSLEILCTREKGEAIQLAAVLDGDNERRKELTRRVEDEATRRIRAMDDLDTRGALVLAGEGWDEGVLGIAAARVVEEFARPAILMSVTGGVAKGSGRSVTGVNLKEQLDYFRSCFVRYGGHAQAVGLTMDAWRVDDFSDRFSARLREIVSPSAGRPLAIDACLDLEECSLDLLAFIARCEPFGYGNKTPVWKVGDVQILRDTTIVGDGHMKLYFQDTRGNPGEAIAFGWDRPQTPEDLHGRAVDLAVTVKQGTYMNRVYPELRLLDIRHHAG
jgi:single-stranded-DNA-specific exonuclease